MPREETIRLRWIAGLIVLAGALFITRLYYLQVIHGKDFKREAEAQYVSVMPNLYDRGNIFFRQKDGKKVAAATVNSGYLIAINPKDIVNKEEAYKAIVLAAPNLRHDEFLEKAGKLDDPYEEVATRVPEDLAKKLLKKNLPGVKIYRQTWRNYPAGSLAAQVIGFVGYKGDELVGRYGLESYYNDTLSRSEKNLYVNFFAELFSNLSDTFFDRNSQDGGDLVLTIEPTVQSYVEGELERVMEEWHSEESGAIVMDPKTGAVYAMASNPSFNLNNYGKVKEQSLFANPLVQDVYEMGSIMKPIAMASGLDSGVVTEQSTYNDTGHVTLNNKTFGNYDGRGRGPGTTMQTVLNDSLNTGVAYVVGRIGNERFADYLLKSFHIGEETGIDLPGERQGLTSNLQSHRDIEFATASFGQGIALSPINMTAALSVLANGGHTVTPHLVDDIEYTSGKVKHITQNPPEQMLKKETSERITRMLVNVVDKALLGGTVKIPEYSIAAKTGTAQIHDPSGGYYEDRYLHTFFGYFPAYDPKFIIFMYTYHPKNGATFASHTLTMPFIRTTKFLLHYYNIPPDRVLPPTTQLGISH